MFPVIMGKHAMACSVKIKENENEKTNTQECSLEITNKESIE